MATPNGYITNWSEIDPGRSYIVFPINGRKGDYHLGRPISERGWQIKQTYFEGGYAALPMPPWDGKDLPQHPPSPVNT